MSGDVSAVQICLTEMYPNASPRFVTAASCTAIPNTHHFMTSLQQLNYFNANEKHVGSDVDSLSSSVVLHCSDI